MPHPTFRAPLRQSSGQPRTARSLSALGTELHGLVSYPEALALAQAGSFLCLRPHYLCLWMTTSAPFSSAAFTIVFKSGSRTSSSANLNLVSSCHSAPGNGFGKFHSLVTYATRSVRRPRFIHSTYRLSLDMVSIFRFSAEIEQATDGLPFPINAGNQTDLSGGDVCE